MNIEVKNKKEGAYISYHTIPSIFLFKNEIKSRLTDSLASDREIGRVFTAFPVTPVESRLHQVDCVHHRHLADVQLVRFRHLRKQKKMLVNAKNMRIIYDVHC